MKYILPYKVSMSDTDAAGVAYFARYYDIAHLAYQEFMAEIGLPLSKIIADGEYIIPIIHSECDYRGPLFLDQEITVVMGATKSSNSSFTLEYDFVTNTESQKGFNEFGFGTEKIATVQTVHVNVSAEERKPFELNATLKAGLERLLT